MTKKTMAMILGAFVSCAVVLIVGLIGWAVDYNSFDEEQVIEAYAKVENIDLSDAKTLIDLGYANINTKDSVTYITVPYEDIAIVSAYDRDGDLLYRTIEQGSVFEPHGILIICSISFILVAVIIFGLQILTDFLKKSYKNYDNKNKKKSKTKKNTPEENFDNTNAAVVYTGEDTDEYNVNNVVL